MSYSPAAHNTATAGRAGFVRLGSGIDGQSDGTIRIKSTGTITVGDRLNLTADTSSTISIFSGAGGPGGGGYPRLARMAVSGSRGVSTSDISPLSGYRSGVTNSPNLYLEIEEGDVGGITLSPNGTTIYGAGTDSGYILRVIDEDAWQLIANGSGEYTEGVPYSTSGDVVGGGSPVKFLLDSSGNLSVASTLYASDIDSTGDVFGRTFKLYNSNTVEGARITLGGSFPGTSLDLHFGETASPKVKIDATATTFSGLIYSSNDTTGGTGIALAPQVYTVGSGGYTPSTTTYPTVTQYFPVAVNLAPASQYEIVYKMWLDTGSTNLTANWVAQFSQTPVLWNSYSRSSYSDTIDGSGDKTSVITNKNTTTNLVGYSGIYMNTPHYIEITIVVHTHATLASTMKLMLGTSTSGGMRLVEGSFIKVTKMPAAVGTFS